jgi:hypothetical protein
MISFFQNNWVRATPAAGLTSSVAAVASTALPLVNTTQSVAAMALGDGLCAFRFCFRGQAVDPIFDRAKAAFVPISAADDDASNALFNERPGHGLKGGGRRRAARYVFCIVCERLLTNVCVVVQQQLQQLQGVGVQLTCIWVGLDRFKTRQTIVILTLIFNYYIECSHEQWLDH